MGHGSEQTCMLPRLEEGVAKKFRGIIRPLRGPEKSHGRAPGPQVLGTSLPQAAQGAAAEGADELGELRWKGHKTSTDLRGHSTK